jgi:hypothetical protein
MLVGEESRFYIEAVEAEVDAIFRSRETFELTGGGAPTLSCQAFVFGIQREEEYQVFVALHSKSCKRNLVYSIAAEKKGKSGYEAAMKGAIDACQAMGYAMESVNLKFSTAMREVVIRDIPVLLSPAAARKAIAQKAELAELERLAMQPEENEAPEEAAAGLSPARRIAREIGRQGRQDEVKAAARKLVAESAVEEMVTATRQAVERLLAPGFEVVRPEGATALAAKAPGKTGQPQLPLPAGGELPVPTTAAVRPKVEQGQGDSKEMQRLAKELERLEAAKSAAEQPAGELAETIRQGAERAEAERVERERLEGAKAMAAERAAEKAEAARQAAERAEAERAERDRLEAAKAAAEQRAAELAETARQAAERAEAERVERERLEAAKSAAEQRAAEVAERARQATERAESRLQPVGAEQRAAELAARQATERAETDGERNASRQKTGSGEGG